MQRHVLGNFRWNAFAHNGNGLRSVRRLWLSMLFFWHFLLIWTNVLPCSPNLNTMSGDRFCRHGVEVNTLSGPISRDIAILSLRCPILSDTFSGRSRLTQNCAIPTPWYLASLRRICAISHFATYRAGIVRHPNKKCERVLRHYRCKYCAIYEKYGCWASEAILLQSVPTCCMICPSMCMIYAPHLHRGASMEVPPPGIPGPLPSWYSSAHLLSTAGLEESASARRREDHACMLV